MGIPFTVEPPAPPAIVIPAEAYAANRTVSLGLPVTRDFLDSRHLRVREGGRTSLADVRILTYWPGGDPKWILASFPVAASGADPVSVEFEIGSGSRPERPRVAINEGAGLVVSADNVRYRVPLLPGRGLVDEVRQSDGAPLGRPGGPALDIVLIDEDGLEYRAWRDFTWVAENGEHRAVIASSGRLTRADDVPAAPITSFVVEMEFDRLRPGPVVRLTLKNDDTSVRKHIRFQSCVLQGRFATGGDGFSVRCPIPESPGEWAGSSSTTILQGRTDLDVLGATSSRFQGPESLGNGYSIGSASPSDESYASPNGSPDAHWVIAGNETLEAFGAIRHLESSWGGLGARASGDLDLALFAAGQGPHTMRYGSWETREALVLLGRQGTIDGPAEAFAFEYPRLARPDNPAVWNRTAAYPARLTSLAAREQALASIDGAAARDLEKCPEAPYRVRYHFAGAPGGSNQWDAAHDYWFAWASTGDPAAYLIAEAWADYRTDRAVPHAGLGNAVNSGAFPVTDNDEEFDTGHRHSHFLPIWFLQTGQLRFDLAAHDELANIYGNSRMSARYMESRITSRLIELGALFSGFARDRGQPDADLLYPRVRDYLGHMLSLRWDFEDPGGSEGWANDPNLRNRDPRTFWAASPGKGDPLVDVTFMVASLLPRALRTYLDNVPPNDPHRNTVALRLVDLADFNWEYLISKSVFPTYRGTFFNFDTRRGSPPAPGFGDPGYDPDDRPDLYHPLYDAFTSAYRETGDTKHLDRAAYWAAAQSVRGGPWVTFHRPDFQTFAHYFARAKR